MTTMTRKNNPAAAKARRTAALSDTTVAEAIIITAQLVDTSATALVRHYPEADLPAGYARRVAGATRAYDHRPATVGEAALALAGAAAVQLHAGLLGAVKSGRGQSHLLTREQATRFHAAAAVLADLDTRVSGSQ